MIIENLFPYAPIGNERIWVMKHILSPGASPHYSGSGGTAARAYHTEVCEQAEAAQDASCDDQHHQSQEQSCAAARKVTPLALPRWRWELQPVMRADRAPLVAALPPRPRPAVVPPSAVQAQVARLAALELPAAEPAPAVLAPRDGRALAG